MLRIRKDYRLDYSFKQQSTGLSTMHGFKEESLKSMNSTVGKYQIILGHLGTQGICILG